MLVLLVHLNKDHMVLRECYDAVITLVRHDLSVRLSAVKNVRVVGF